MDVAGKAQYWLIVSRWIFQGRETAREPMFLLDQEWLDEYTNRRSVEDVKDSRYNISPPSIHIHT